MHERPILLIGGNGQVGHELRRTLAPLGTVLVWNRDQADLTHPEDLRERVARVSPSLVVNAAAYTAVDRAEVEPELAHTINAEAPGQIAKGCTDVGARLIHYSTDYVFDGTSRTPYRESDPTDPLGVYGQTKLAGESAVLATDPAHLVLRVSWVYGCRGKNFLLTMLRLASEGKPVRVVSDQLGSPTWSRMIAEATALIANRLQTEGEEGGLYHLPSAGVASWHDFATEIFSLASVRPPSVCPIPTEDYPTPARRPNYSVLGGEKTEARFGICLPHWQEQLRWVMEDGGFFRPGL